MDSFRAKEEEYNALKDEPSKATFTSVIEQIVDSLPSKPEEPESQPKTAAKPKEVRIHTM